MTDNKLTKYFEVVKKTDLNSINVGDSIPTSDFTTINDKGEFVQFEYHDLEEDDGNPVFKPGIYALDADRYDGVVHKETKFTQNKMCMSYLFTDKIKHRVDNFFNKLDIYKKYDTFPKRGMLLYGFPGNSKTSSVIETVSKYAESDACVIIWPTAKLKAYAVKDYIKKAVYKDVTKLFLIAEDIGGAEYEGGGKMMVDSSLLSLLDNMEQTFTIPTYIIATTNYPENLLSSLTDRPQRFDDVIEATPPTSDQRAELLSFFAPDLISKEPDVLQEIKKSKYDGFSVSHIKDLPIRAELYDTTLREALYAMAVNRKKAKDNFQKAENQMGFKLDDEG